MVEAYENTMDDMFQRQPANDISNEINQMIQSFTNQK
jgi:hypothetical protein